MSSPFIQITGPHTRLGYCGDRNYWNVGILNPASGKYLDLVPWNEHASLSLSQAQQIAQEASEATGFSVQGYRLETVTTSRLVLDEGVPR